MAKGNLFLGTAAKSVGDVVMYRRDGSQVSRVRVRKVANPKTDAQCEQRAFMSAVVKFYQPLANVLDRSWQGMSRSKSYAKFLKTNAAKVREMGLYLKKGHPFFPLPLQLSNGTIMNVDYSYTTNGISLDFSELGIQMPTFTTIGNLSTVLVALGANEGDVVTFIFGTGSVDGEGKVDAPQFIIKSDSNVTLAAALPSLFFNVADLEDGEVKISSRIAGSEAGAIILARNVDGEWKRTTTYLEVNGELLAAIGSAEAKAEAIASYKGSAASDNPLVYLDGDELENA